MKKIQYQLTHLNFAESTDCHLRWKDYWVSVRATNLKRAQFSATSWNLKIYSMSFHTKTKAQFAPVLRARVHDWSLVSRVSQTFWWQTHPKSILGKPRIASSLYFIGNQYSSNIWHRISSIHYISASSGVLVHEPFRNFRHCFWITKDCRFAFRQQYMKVNLILLEDSRWLHTATTWVFTIELWDPKPTQPADINLIACSHHKAF